VFGLDAGVRLIADIANGTVVGYAHSGMPELFTRTIDVTRQHINRRLGSALSMDDITNLLDRFGFAYDVAGETVSVQVPFERLDLTIPENIIEEIGRAYGYDNIETQPLPPFAEVPIVHPIHAASERIRTTLDALGFTEIYTYSLREEGAVALANSLASDKSHLRENLSDALKEKLQLNENNAPLLGLDVVRLYEIGNVFTKNGEELHVALGIRPLALKKREDRAAEEMGKAVTALKEALGVSLPDGDSEVYEFNMGDILTDLVLSSYPPAPSIQPQVTYEPFSVYPFALRDVAVWTPNGAPVEDIREVIREHAGALLVRLDLFDAFTKEGRTSYAFHLVFQAQDRTLSEEEITAAMERVTGAFTEAGYEVR
jgi:phenylalanyl-tRNA synthetase beta chain